MSRRASKKDMKVRVPQGAGLTRFVLGPVGRILVIGFALFIILGMGTFTYFYAKYSRLNDEKLRAGPFANTAKIFAAAQSRFWPPRRWSRWAWTCPTPRS